MELIAHRGASFAAPENSLEAFQRAIEQGADRIELDVRFPSDGVPVVMHAARTGRTGDRDIEVRAAPVRAFSAVHLSNGETAPTLESACALMKGKVPIDLEIKAARASQLAALLEVLRRHELERDAVITAFDGEQLSRCRALGFGGRLGLLVGSKSMKPRKRAFEFWPLGELARSGASDLVIHHKLAHRLLKIGLRRRGYGLALWFSIEDEQESSEVRAAMYQRCALHGAWGAVVGRVSEARVAIAGG